MPGPIFVDRDPITLRTLEREDVPFLVENSNDPEMRPFTGHRLPDTTERIEATFFDEEGDGVSLLACVDGDPVGLVGLSPRSPTSRTVFGLTGVMEMGLWITPDAQGNGFGRKSAEALITYAFDDLRLHKMSARVFDFNEPSRALFEESLGFQHEGVQRDEIYLDGSYHDIHYYGLLDAEWSVDG
jgi:RimJ/RimL family protein N-acetyltransferase